MKRFSQLAIALAILIGIPGCGAERPLPLAPPEVGGSESLQKLLESIRSEHKLPALAALVIRDGRVVDQAAVGRRKQGDPTRVTVHDKWHIGSITKPMTATLAAMLVEQGHLSWTNTVGELFPEWRTRIRPEYTAVTLEQLLSHRGGLPKQPPRRAWRQAWEMQEAVREQRWRFLQAVLAEPPAAPPSTRFIYSNQGYTLVGAMIEKVTGHAWEEVIREKLFQPLGMDSAGFGAPATPGKADQPWGHTGGWLGLSPVPPGPKADNPPAIGPAGRVHCSLRDLAKFVLLHLQSGRSGQGTRALLQPSTLARLHRPIPGQDYALGWVVVDRDWAGGKALTHAGSNTMFYAVVWLAPRKQFAVIVATNCAGDDVPKACDQTAWKLIQQYLK